MVESKRAQRAKSVIKNVVNEEVKAAALAPVQATPISGKKTILFYRDKAAFGFMSNFYAAPI